MSTERQSRNIVIIGGGIIGSSTAYFLSHHPSFSPFHDSITLLEATSIASGASGKAGGLLALWAYPACIVPLSFRLHAELAQKYGGAERWGYRSVGCGSVDLVAAKGGKRDGEGKQHVSLEKRARKGGKGGVGVPEDLDWLEHGVRNYEEMGNQGETAQVHPFLFTSSMAQLAQDRGVKIVFGKATAINQKEDAVASVTYTPKGETEVKTTTADTVILTAGPWTQSLCSAAPISALRAHSVTIRPSRPVSAYALFTSIRLPTGATVTPEIYARPNNEVYACGDGDTLVPLPASSDLVQCDASRCEDIISQVSSVSTELRDGEVTARQACYLPNVEGRGGGPLVGRTSVEGLLMGAGHTCWGIQNGPGTGKVLSELVWEGRVECAEVGGLDPRRWGV